MCTFSNSYAFETKKPCDNEVCNIFVQISQNLVMF